MTLKLTVLALSLGLSVVAANAQTMDLGPDSTGYQRFLLYPHLERGFDAMSRDDRSIALSEFEQAHALAPNNPVVALHLAQAYRRFGEPARAEALLRDQPKHNPGNRRLNQALADLRGTTSKPGRAASTARMPATPRTPKAAAARPADEVPVDDSGYGFDNIGDVLTVSPMLMEKYLAAASKGSKLAV